MNKLGIWGIAIAAAFVAGSMITGSMAFADKDNKKNNPVAEAIDRLTTVMQETTTQGPEGPPGPIGPIGPPNTLIVTERDVTLVQLGGFKIADVVLSCDAGEKAVGSAIQSAIPNTFARTNVIVDAPNYDDPNISQWEMKIENPHHSLFISFNVSVMCAKLGN